MATEIAKGPIIWAPVALLELTARHPYDPLGNVDVYMPGRWDTTSNLIFMDTIRQVGPDIGEWEGSVAYVEFKPQAPGSFLIVVHVTGYETTFHLHGPWGDNTTYTAQVTDAGALLALWNGGQMEFTINCDVPNNEYGIGYLESIQVFPLT